MINLLDLVPQTNRQPEFISFPNYGVVKHNLTSKQLEPVWEEVNEIKNNFSNFENLKNNHNLAGNLKKEYTLTKSVDHLDKLIAPLIEYYDMLNNYKNSVKNSDIEVDSYKLKGSWVNFQEKHEFNPIHNHGGFMSFVIWLKVPYLIEDELKNLSGVNSNNNLPAHFQFAYTNTLGDIQSYNVPVDKTWENTLMLFPSKLIHSVYPFFSSDDHRISVSGNFYFSKS
jgi:hypothetical protein